MGDANHDAAQKRAQAKVDYDAFLAGCPSRQLLDRISDKWVALILAALAGDPSIGASRDPCATRSCPVDWPESARRC